MKYTSRSDYHKGSPSAYSSSWNNNWLCDYDWFLPKSEKKNMSVYSYEFIEQRTVYVGITKNLHQRHLQHLGVGNYHWKTAVYRFASEKQLDIPQPRCIYLGVTELQAQLLEEETIKGYINDGWTILNSAKTGIGVSSLGAHNYIWSKENCRIEADKYPTKKAFHSNNAGAYTSALKNGWLEEFYPHSTQPTKQHPKGYWDSLDNCKQEAGAYKDMNSFRKHNYYAYRKVKQNGWLELLFSDTCN